jgi:hypothetical protein
MRVAMMKDDTVSLKTNQLYVSLNKTNNLFFFPQVDVFPVRKSVVDRVATNKNFPGFLYDLMVSVYTPETMATRSKTGIPGAHHSKKRALNQDEVAELVGIA